MKFIFLAGGFAGFFLTSLTGFIVGRAPDLVLRDSALGCLAGALLFRWFWSVFVKALTEAVAIKRAAADAAAAAAAAAEAASSPVKAK
jgi:hypothetical protein